MTDEYRNQQKIPIWRKINLTVTEAALYSGIGENTIREMLNGDGCDFAFRVGKKYLINRELFEEYIKQLCAGNR